MITFADKVDSITSSEAQINKITASDINEIKSEVNRMIQTVDISITRDSYASANATPETIISDPGSNKVIEIDSAILFETGGSVNYDAGTLLFLRYENDANNILQISRTNAQTNGAEKGSAGSTILPNKAVVYTNSGSPSNGDKTYTLRVKYYIEDFN